MPKLIWVGAFPPSQSNAGDHAQTLAIEKFLNNNLLGNDLHIFYRTEVGSDRWEKETANLTPDDLILINSSGDFGSRYSGWHDIRGQIVRKFQNTRIINLPTTVYYSSDRKGQIVLERDKEIYNSPNFTLLCREPESERIASRHFDCYVQYFPDFVFYLQPEIKDTQRVGALVNLRSDGESALTEVQRAKVFEQVYRTYPLTEMRDMHKLPFDITPDIRERYINGLFAQYQSRELIVTDMMHGMIFAVINQIPCVALDDAIPHKLSGYKYLLEGAVEFADSIESIPKCITTVTQNYEPKDFTPYFEDFECLVTNFIG
jgi:exopolysaccharide biosynthesis predicted pyruvyltransferase EpsI